MVLDFSASGHLQGEEFLVQSSPQFDIRYLGTAPVRELVIVHNFRFVYRAQSDSPSMAFTWRDAAPEHGTNMYYVRVLQVDGELAWSSPLWIELP